MDYAVPLRAPEAGLSELLVRLYSVVLADSSAADRKANRKNHAKKSSSANSGSTEPSPRRQEDINQQAARLMDTYGNSILRLAYSYLHNMSDAEDILQDTLIQFLKTQPVLSEPVQEKAWLLRVAGNLSKNKIKYNKVRLADELQETLVADGKDDLSFVWEAVKELPEKYREVIHLYYYEGFSTIEIAAILNRNESTIRSDLRRGREKLKAVLKGAFDFE